MSAFMVTDKTINVVVTFLKHQFARDMRYLGEQFAESGYPLETEANCEKLGKAMFSLNIGGVNTRYKSGASSFRPLDYKFRLEPGYSPIQAYKSLSCFLYQCSEGDIEEEDLYKLLDKAKNTLAQFIVNRLEEYDQANWDF